MDQDSDGGGLRDGVEDWNRNGAIDPGESDPNDPLDDTLQLHVDPIYAGGTATFHTRGGVPRSWLYVCYSLTGPGPTTLPNGLILDLDPPIRVLAPFQLDSWGEGHLGPLPVPSSVQPCSGGGPVKGICAGGGTSLLAPTAIASYITGCLHFDLIAGRLLFGIPAVACFVLVLLGILDRGQEERNRRPWWRRLAAWTHDGLWLLFLGAGFILLYLAFAPVPR